jgi:hypothetical protein
LLSGLDFLAAAARERERQLRVADVHRGLIELDLLPVVVAIEPRQRRALLHPLAFFYRQLRDPSGDFEAQRAFVRFDVAGNFQRVVRRLRAGEARIEIIDGRGQRGDQHNR